MRIYLSAPLFTQVERRWNRLLGSALRERVQGAEVILPQDLTFGDSFNQTADFPRIFRVATMVCAAEP